MSDLLDLLLRAPGRPFALLHRPLATGPMNLEVLTGEVSTVPTLADISLGDPSRGPGPRSLAMIPYRQVAERGLECVDDDVPLQVMDIRDYAVLEKSSALDRLPQLSLQLSGAGFDIDDAAYAAIVRNVVTGEIGTGEGANFVIKRSFHAQIDDYHLGSALSFFRRLCEQESGVYWSFLVHTGDRTFIGATPERHLSLVDGVATMNPISGTYRYPADGPTLSGVLDFLSDGKETDELDMVVDEELKMMSGICDGGIRVIGPRLKEMTRLAHTEYLIEGRTSRDVRTILRETLIAPTVTGSPVENACRVIKRHERRGRGYYSGVVALIGEDRSGHQTMDSALLIRTAEIGRTGRIEIGVGATLVRHSDPESEAAETRAKLAALMKALGGGRTPLRKHPEVQAALARRNTRLASFWFTQEKPDGVGSRLRGLRALVVDAEDTFTSMIACQLGSLGLEVSVRRFDEPYRTDDHDLVILGPGPGDPCDLDDPKIAHLYAVTRSLLDRRRPFLAVCLSHQVLSSVLGIDVIRREVPNQGVQREVMLFGKPEVVGFYNTFAANCAHDHLESALAGHIEISRDTATGEVHALRGARFASMQFHAESVLTADGPSILRGLLESVLPVSSELRS